MKILQIILVSLGILSLVGCATTHIKPYEAKKRDDIQPARERRVNYCDYHVPLRA